MARHSWLLAALFALVPPGLCASSATIPAPIVVSPSQYWEGNDGPWSSFTIQVGTPAQNVRVFISTAGTSTFVVAPEGCTTTDPVNCPDLRGQEFNNNASLTWIPNSFYGLQLESNLGYTGNGKFGFDKVGISWQGSGGPVLDHQVVAGIVTHDFWLGTFGLTPRPTNFSNFNNPQPSYMETLKNKSMIPSLSWSYTAGAPYRYSKVLGSLILGGYDESKSGKNISIDFGSDISRDLTVGLQSISAASSQGTNFDLLPDGIFTFIDSTVPHIWLPIPACQRFEKAFGLTLDNKTGLYLINDTLHTILTNNNASFVFKVGNLTKGGQTVDITFPYAAFDLTVDYPIVANKTRYFPIRRADNDTQYTLGRTFLQEAYLTADYERAKFYVSQTQWKQGAAEHIITISSPSSLEAEMKPKKFPIGAIIGLVIAGVLILGTIIFIFFIRRRKAAVKSDDPPPPFESPAIEMTTLNNIQDKPELDGAPATTIREFYHPDKHKSYELHGTSRGIHEMLGSEPRVEIEGSRSGMSSPEPRAMSPVSQLSGRGSTLLDEGSPTTAIRDSVYSPVRSKD